MSMQTGENEQGLRQIMDLTRMISIVVLLLHCYYFCYGAFKEWQLTAPLSDRLLKNIAHSGLFKHFEGSKLISIGLLMVSMLGVRGRKGEHHNYRTAIAYLATGCLLYFGSRLCLYLPSEATIIGALYILITATGFLLVMTGGSVLTRIIKANLSNEVFNTENETFPQEERLLTNEYSFNIPAQYRLKKEWRASWVNLPNPQRGLLISGNPGSGKTAFILTRLMRQQAQKGYTQFHYDLKYPELTLLAYNLFLQYGGSYKVKPSFYTINFTRPELSHRCNPLNPAFMRDIVDAIEASRTILLSINKTWAGKQGDFFVESPMNLLASVIWFLRNFKNGEYCTLPHAIELLQEPYDNLFTLLRSDPTLSTILNPFISVYLADVMETLESQIASVKIPLGRLSSPLLYYIMSGNDFSLDINNPSAPKIVCMGNDPTKAEALAPILSLYADRMNRIINVPGQTKCAVNYDEFSSIRAESVQQLIASGRSNLIGVTICFQDVSQLRKVYSREEAETIWNMAGNIISGQVAGDSARMLAERFPKTMQDRQSLSINSMDTSLSKSKQLEQAITASTISNLSSGEFVGIVADNPDQPIELKAFRCRVLNDLPAQQKEKAAFKPLPVIRQVDEAIIQRNFEQIKQDIQDIVDAVMEDILNDPSKAHLLVKK